MEQMNKPFERDVLTKKIIQKATIEQPSFDFTQKIMGKILVPATPEAFIYKPVISKSGWFISVAAIAVVLTAIVYITPSSPSSGILSNYITTTKTGISNATSNLFSSFSISNSFSWIVVVIIAGWLLFAADKYFRKLNAVS